MPRNRPTPPVMLAVALALLALVLVALALAVRDDPESTRSAGTAVARML
jgi:hypothetical protein